ncbi:hypothetical protein NKH17_24565 [Mesorhizobium sp. M1334]|uniref:hypothetical protein n=1 Tax=Mesorhizobium sp. M1334 TaxID=2957084 RepID=UPI00333A9B78
MPSNLDEFIESFFIDTSAKSESITFSLRLNALAIIKRTYDLFGLTDYYIVIHSIDAAPCADESSAKCLAVVAQYWPSALRPQRLVGTKAELAQNLSVLVLRGALRNAGDEWRSQASPGDTPPFIMAPDIPSTMVGLDAVAKGVQLLQLGPAHEACRDKTDLECIKVAQSFFELSIVEEAKAAEQTLSPIAAFGQSLIEIDSALRASRKLASELTVEGHLHMAELSATRALTSESLRAISESTRWDDFHLDLLQLGGLRPNRHLIDLSRRFACALADYRRADWQGCIKKVREIKDVPSSLQPYLEAAQTDATLGTATAEDLQNELKALNERIGSLGGNSDASSKLRFALRRIMLKHVCSRPDTADLASFEEMIRATVNDAPSVDARRGVLLQSASCRTAQTYPSTLAVAEIIKQVKGMRAGGDRPRFMLLISEYRLRSGDLDDAYETAVEALELPWAGAFIRNTSDFARLLQYGAKGEALYLAALSVPNETASIETCEGGDEYEP